MASSLALEEKALADFIKIKLGFGSAVTKELRDAGITSLETLIREGREGLKRTKLSPVVQRRIMQVVDHSGRDYLQRCEQERIAKAGGAPQQPSPPQEEASAPLPRPPSPPPQVTVPPPHAILSTTSRVSIHVNRCMELAGRCQDTAKQATLLLDGILHRVADIEQACSHDQGSTGSNHVPGNQAALWSNEVQAKLKEVEATMESFLELQKRMEESWLCAEKAEDGPVSVTMGQLLSKASIATTAVDQAKVAVKRKQEEAQGRTAGLMSLCTRIEVEDLMTRSEQAAHEFEGKTREVQEMIAALISAAEEVVKENEGGGHNNNNNNHPPGEGGHDKNDGPCPDRSKTRALVHKLGVVKSKVLVLEREEVKPVLKAKIKALSKVRNTSHTMLMDTEGGEWKHCIKHMRRLDRASDEIMEQFDRLEARVNDAHSRVQAACRAVGGSLAELMTLPPRERPYMIRLNPPEDGLLAAIEGTRNGRPIISTIRASTTGELDLSSFSPGTYTVRISTEATPPILLHEAQVVVTVQGKGKSALIEVEPSVLELPATPMVFSFRLRDQPLTEATVTATFLPRNQNTAFTIQGLTDDRGDFRIVLPAGTVLPGMAASKEAENGEVVRQEHELVLVEPPALPHPEALRRVLSTITAVESSGFQEIVGINDHATMAVILGDISGSMYGAGKLKSLKRSMEKIYTDCVKRRIPVGLLAWNAWVYKCPLTTLTETHPDAEQWIDSLTPAGCNDMRYALEEALRTYPQASDIYVICDGDICPFCLLGGQAPKEDVPQPALPDVHAVKQPYNLTNWLAFRKRYPTTRFHFVALRDGADSRNLQHMSALGGGDFYEDALISQSA